MSKQIIAGAKLYIDGYDLSGDMNAIAYTYGADVLDATTIGDTTRKRVGGLKTFQASHAGLWEGGTAKVDDVLNSRLGLNAVSTICPTTGAEAEPALFGTMLEAIYAPGASVGEMFAFGVQMESVSPLYNGTVLHNATRTVTGTGTIFTALGAVSSLQKAEAALHVIAASGTTPSLTVKVQSAPTSGFAAPVDRFVFGAKSTIGAEQMAPLSGPITDAFWRVTWTISGGTPSFTFVVPFSIQ